jgi:hypothetical protein
MLPPNPRVNQIRPDTRSAPTPHRVSPYAAGESSALGKSTSYQVARTLISIIGRLTGDPFFANRRRTPGIVAKKDPSWAPRSVYSLGSGVLGPNASSDDRRRQADLSFLIRAGGHSHHRRQTVNTEG